MESKEGTARLHRARLHCRRGPGPRYDDSVRHDDGGLHPDRICLAQIQSSEVEEGLYQVADKARGKSMERPVP